MDEETLRERLMTHLSYNASTGEFYWKIPGPGRRKSGLAGNVLKNKKTFYVHIQFEKKVYKAHRLVWLFMNGCWPNGEIDHQDGNGLNNKWTNLRDVTRSANSMNISESKNNKSGCTGVRWKADKNRWKAYIQKNYKEIHLGYFKSFGDAVTARKDAEKKMGFHENHGRKPGPASESLMEVWCES